MTMVIHDIRNPTVSIRLGLQETYCQLNRVTEQLGIQDIFKREFLKVLD
jgi:hypothetical protein